MVHDKKILEYYEEVYRGNTRELRNNLNRIGKLFKRFPVAEGDKVLDLGCGFGTVMQYFTRSGARPVGIDISHEAAKIASQGGKSTALQANAEVLPFAARSFDKAVFVGTLEHFPDPVRSIKEVVRVLKPNAYVCFIVPNSRFPLFRYMGGTGQIYEVPRTYTEWGDMFTRQGFVIETTYRDPGPGFFDRGIAGLPKKLILMLFNLLPVQFTYQFVYVCRKKQ